MQYVLSFIFASLLVAAQSSWKVAVGAETSPFKHGFTLVSTLHFVFSPLVILGAVIYAVATALYMYLLSKYQFSHVQSLSIPLSLIVSIVAATVFFDDKLSIVNYFGLALVVTGIVLITTK
jgi:drug/metabolite transporter (DMT)-like permease